MRRRAQESWRTTSTAGILLRVPRLGAGGPEAVRKSRKKRWSNTSKNSSGSSWSSSKKIDRLKGSSEEELKAAPPERRGEAAAFLKETLKDDQRSACPAPARASTGSGRSSCCTRTSRSGKTPEDHGRATEAIHGCDPGHAKEDRAPHQRGPVGCGNPREKSGPKVMKITQGTRGQRSRTAFSRMLRRSSGKEDAREAVETWTTDSLSRPESLPGSGTMVVVQLGKRVSGAEWHWKMKQNPFGGKTLLKLYPN